MIFTYWQGEPASTDAFLADWQAVHPKIRVFGEAEVTALVAEHYPYLRAVFERISIPACKSDLARLVLLHRYGGFYVDAHTSPRDRPALAGLVALLDRYEVVIFVSGETLDRAVLYVLNGAVLARAHAPVLAALIDVAADNLARQAAAEAQADRHVPYNIAALTGGWLLASRLCDCRAPPFAIRHELQDRVHRVRLGARDRHPAFEWYQHYHYRLPGQHWSERQTTERLFKL